jgi:hypothetical protein
MTLGEAVDEPGATLGSQSTSRVKRWMTPSWQP